ncbi:MAG: type II secretion system protein [Patescibacteria group bacterium]
MEKILNNKRGYTLVELLVAMILLITVGGIMAGIIVISLRGSNRSTNVNDIRQEGNYALSQMTKMITYAQTFEGISDGTKDVNTGDLVYTKDCTVNSPTHQYSFLKISSFDQGKTTFVCSTGLQGDFIASYGAALTTWPLITGNNTPSVKYFNEDKHTVSACYFTCIQENSSVTPNIGISFTVQKPDTTIVENKVSLDFETTVGFRNSN